MISETGFDEDFYWENINYGYENVSKSIEYKDVECLYSNSVDIRRKFMSQLATLILRDERIRLKECEAFENLEVEDRIIGMNLNRTEHEIFENFFLKDTFKSLIFSDFLDCDRHIDKETKRYFWLISVYAANVDKIGGIPEFILESEKKELCKSIDPLVQTYCQKFTMAYELPLHSSDWDPRHGVKYFVYF